MDVFIPPVEYLMITVKDLSEVDEEIKPKGILSRNSSKRSAQLSFSPAFSRLRECLGKS